MPAPNGQGDATHAASTKVGVGSLLQAMAKNQGLGKGLVLDIRTGTIKPRQDAQSKVQSPVHAEASPTESPTTAPIESKSSRPPAPMKAAAGDEEPSSESGECSCASSAPSSSSSRDVPDTGPRDDDRGLAASPPARVVRLMESEESRTLPSGRAFNSLAATPVGAKDPASRDRRRRTSGEGGAREEVRLKPRRVVEFTAPALNMPRGASPPRWRPPEETRGEVEDGETSRSDCSNSGISEAIHRPKVQLVGREEGSKDNRKKRESGVVESEPPPLLRFKPKLACDKIKEHDQVRERDRIEEKKKSKKKSKGHHDQEHNVTVQGTEVIQKESKRRHHAEKEHVGMQRLVNASQQKLALPQPIVDGGRQNLDSRVSHTQMAAQKSASKNSKKEKKHKKEAERAPETQVQKDKKHKKEKKRNRDEATQDQGEQRLDYIIGNAREAQLRQPVDSFWGRPQTTGSTHTTSVSSAGAHKSPASTSGIEKKASNAKKKKNASPFDLASMTALQQASVHKQPKKKHKKAKAAASSGSNSSGSESCESSARKRRGKRRKRSHSRHRRRRGKGLVCPPDGWTIWPPPSGSNFPPPWGWPAGYPWPQNSNPPQIGSAWAQPPVVATVLAPSAAAKPESTEPSQEVAPSHGDAKHEDSKSAPPQRPLQFTTVEVSQTLDVPIAEPAQDITPAIEQQASVADQFPQAARLQDEEARPSTVDQSPEEIDSDDEDEDDEDSSDDVILTEPTDPQGLESSIASAEGGREMSPVVEENQENQTPMEIDDAVTTSAHEEVDMSGKVSPMLSAEGGKDELPVVEENQDNQTLMEVDDSMLTSVYEESEISGGEEQCEELIDDPAVVDPYSHALEDPYMAGLTEACDLDAGEEDHREPALGVAEVMENDDHAADLSPKEDAMEVVDAPLLEPSVEDLEESRDIACGTPSSPGLDPELSCDSMTRKKKRRRKSQGSLTPAESDATESGNVGDTTPGGGDEWDAFDESLRLLERDENVSEHDDSNEGSSSSRSLLLQ